jgi:sulfoxide reductase heme-binding subunit YedZ
MDKYFKIEKNLPFRVALNKMDFRNTPAYHLIVALVSLLLILILYFNGIGLNRAVAGVAFFLLFLTLFIGPFMKLQRPQTEVLPWNLPWSWRGELGIWFTILSLVHWRLSCNLSGTIRLSGLMGLVALGLSLILALTSNPKALRSLGINSWKWLQNFAYVIFYLVGLHTIHYAFLRPGRPLDWLHWFYLLLILVIIVLQAAAFIKTVKDYRRSMGR